MRKTCPCNHRVWSVCLPLCPTDGHCFTLVNTGSLSLQRTPWSLRKPLWPRVLRHRALLLLINSHGLPLAKQHEGKQGGATLGGRGWRSKLIPHVPQEETFQAALAYLAGGVQQTLRAPSCTFRPHTAVHWSHMDPFGSTMASQGTIYFFGKNQSSKKSQCFRETKRTLNRQREENKVTNCSGKLN